MNIILPVEQIEALIEHEYGLRILEPLAEMRQGVHSKAWLTTTDDGQWVAKASNPASDSEAKLQAHSLLYRFLHEQGINAPVVRADRRGRSVSQVEYAGQHYPVMLMQYHELRRLDSASVTMAEMQQIGSTIARLHQVLEQFPGASNIIADHTKSENEWGKQTVGVYDELVAAPTSVCFTQDERIWIKSVDADAIAYIDACFPAPGSVTQAILHGDLSFEHVRLLPDGQVYLFDFGDLCWGPVAHELGQFLRSLRDIPISFRRWAELRRWLIESYSTHYALKKGDIEAIDLFILNRIVAQARYILELSGDEVSPQGAAVIKCTYALAASMLSGHHITQAKE
jgi:Ser/Thr protein kinase RdoA (MazF antagonist)